MRRKKNQFISLSLFELHWNLLLSDFAVVQYFSKIQFESFFYVIKLDVCQMNY